MESMGSLQGRQSKTTENMYIFPFACVQYVSPLLSEDHRLTDHSSSVSVCIVNHWNPYRFLCYPLVRDSERETDARYRHHSSDQLDIFPHHKRYRGVGSRYESLAR